MPVASTTSGTTSVEIVGSITPTIYNVSAVLTGTEYAQVLSSDVTQLSVRSRGGAKVQFSFSTGTTDTSYITIPAGSTWYEKDLRLINATLYFEVDQADTIEIMEWT